MEKVCESEKWLLAHHDPLASLNTFSNCLALADLHGDGEVKLVIADMGSEPTNMKLKVFKGTSLMSENTLIDCPTGLITFHMDTTEPRVPAVAVASGSYIYIYKNLRPYFKFTLPTLEVNSLEFDAWNQARDEVLDVAMLAEILGSLRHEVGECGLTTRSQKFLICSDAEAQKQFLENHKSFLLKRQTVVTCIETLKKNQDQDDEAISCLVLGTESSNVYILDPEAFLILTNMTLPSVPVHMSVSGLYDVEFRILVACRNGSIYTLKRNSKTGKPTVELTSQPVGLLRRGKSMVVATMDEKLQCYNNKGKRLWSVDLPASVACIESINLKHLAQELIAVSLKDNRIQLYFDKHLVDTIQLNEFASSMKFGRYGRENNALVLVLRGGALVILLLRRTSRFPTSVEEKEKLAPMKLNIPKKTKLFVDQTMRERDNAVLMHRVFQHDLYRLRLSTARAYVHALETSNNPLTLSQLEPLKLSAQVLGLGPTFKLKVEVQNTSSSNPSLQLAVVFHCDDQLYDIANTCIPIPMLVPGVLHSVETLVTALSELGISDTIRVFVVKMNNPKPVLSAIINMPVAEIFTM